MYSLYEYSCVLIVPADCQYLGNNFANALGYGFMTFSVPLASTSTSNMLAFYGAHSWVTEDFVTLMQDAKKGIVSQDILNKGFTLGQVSDLMDQLLVSIMKGGEARLHFNDVLLRYDLVQIGVA